MMAEPKEITFRLEPNDDPELTCIVCYPTSRRLCEWVFTVKGDGKTTTIAVHDSCVPKLEKRNPTPGSS